LAICHRIRSGASPPRRQCFAMPAGSRRSWPRAGTPQNIRRQCKWGKLDQAATLRLCEVDGPSGRGATDGGQRGVRGA
jgi:hypothetical protein